MCLRGVLTVAAVSSLVWSAFCHPGIAGQEEQLTEAMVRHSFEKTQSLEQPISLAELGRQLRYACQADLDLPGMGGVADGGLGGPPTTHSLAAGECNQYLTSIFPDAVALLSHGASDLEPQPSLIDVAHLDARLSAAARFLLPTDTLAMPVQRLGDYLDYRSSSKADETGTRAVWGHAAGSARPGAGGHWPRSIIPLLVSHVFCGNDHVRWENEFRVARQRLATEILGVAEGTTLEQPEEILGLTAAVACQAFLTDYAFYEDELDLHLVEGLVRRLRASEDLLPEDASARLLIAACATYRTALPFVKSWASFPQWESAYLAERESSSASWPFWQLWRLAVAEPLREQELRQELAPSETQRHECAAGASVSCAVRTMYEQHPYPKWSRDPPLVRWPADPQDWLDILGFVRPHVWPSITSSRPMKVLWAGCGTGYMLTLFARHFGGLVEIWAVDLSLASLAYASRRISELGLTNVHFVQGDILVLPEGITSQAPFDFMESSGVIHHLEKPAEALARLVDLLRPGAALNLALYSTFARRDTVTPCREAGKAYNVSSDDSVREFRRMLIAMGSSQGTQATWAREIIRTEDFASLTGIRDLCLHPQERTFTLLQIGKLLNRVGLRWRRFAPTFSSTVPQLFEQRFGVDAFSKQATLKKWHEFEKENPHTFAAMYQFFVQKSCADGACRTDQEEL